MARVVVVYQKQPAFSLPLSSLSDFSGIRLSHSIQYKRNAWQKPRGALQVSASSTKKILIIGGTRFIGIFLSRLLVKERHQVTLFTRGKTPITQQLPGESDEDFSAFASKIISGWEKSKPWFPKDKIDEVVKDADKVKIWLEEKEAEQQRISQPPLLRYLVMRKQASKFSTYQERSTSHLTD